ncbi:hypothetical protein IFM89_009239 [Coptis chinensis]|uniref:Uncharacterized protein n=1 Tax=Coptis chinensis TaxID=261450 RepID=A0A835MDI3_9MAGN|nr:hypothetical protein IFM89_009239 [Coptis chinensis]
MHIPSQALQTRISPEQRTWSSLLKTPPSSAGSEELCYIKPTFSDDVLVIEEFILEEGVKEWEDRVVGFFLDKKLPYTLVKENVKKRWKLLGWRCRYSLGWGYLLLQVQH